eukprot:12745285-Ditylum_brightwellii.AAC.1
MMIAQYKATVLQHMMNNGLWDIFNIPDPQTVNTSNSFHALLLTKTKLTSLKISEYQGENVQDLNFDIYSYAAKLDCTEVFLDDILLEIYAIYEESSDLKERKMEIYFITSHILPHARDQTNSSGGRPKYL